MSDKTLTVIRIAELDDTQAILDIYAPYVTDTAITLVSELPTVDDVRKKMVEIKKTYPYLVCSVGERVVAFAFADCIRPHEPYRWNVELCIYVDPGFHGRGIATALYTALFQILKLQGFLNLYALITLPNEASIALHEHFGFKQLALHKADGYKMGSWRDVLWMQYRIENEAQKGTLRSPTLFSQLRKNETDTALIMATALLIGVQ